MSIQNTKHKALREKNNKETKDKPDDPWQYK